MRALSGIWITHHPVVLSSLQVLLSSALSHLSNMGVFFLISSPASLAVALCSHGTTLFPRDSAFSLPQFGYDGLNGPLGWYGLDTTTN